MRQSKLNSRFFKGILMGSMVLGFLALAVFPALSAKKVKNETIEATAMGTGTQMGQMINISVEIYDFSTPEDTQVLVRHSRRVKTRDWSTLSPKCMQSGTSP